LSLYPNLKYKDIGSQKIGGLFSFRIIMKLKFEFIVTGKIKTSLDDFKIALELNKLIDEELEQAIQAKLKENLKCSDNSTGRVLHL
jgi:hypothetical protein